VYRDPFRLGGYRRRPRRGKLLEFVRPGTGDRIVPQLTLEPKEPEETSFVGKYLDLADQALQNHDLPNPAARPKPKSKRKAV
jgi:hypothetical protein